MKLYIVRHGQTDWNRDGRLQGCSDIELNETGRGQAVALGQFLSGHEIGQIISSPLSRARETAALLRAQLKAPTQYSENDLLMERSFGAIEGGNLQDYLSDLSTSGVADHVYKPSGGESLTDVLDRAMMFHGTLARYEHQLPVCLVSHGVFLGTLIRILLSHQDPFDHKAYRIGNGSVTIVNIKTNGLAEIELFNHPHEQ